MRKVLHNVVGRGDALMGIIALAAFFGIFFLVFLKIPQGLVSEKGTTVTAMFANAAQLSKEDPVRVDGVVAGKVTGLRVLDGGRSTQVDMEVFDSALPLYRNARAALKWRTLLGASFVVDLDRGRPAAGKLAENTIPLSRTSAQVEVDDLTEIAQGGAKLGVRRTLTELPQAFTDHAAPAAAFGGIADVSPGLAATARSLRGQAPGDVTGLVQHTAKIVAALDAPVENVHDLVQGGAATLAVTSGRSEDIQDTIDEAASVLPRMQTTLLRLNTTLHGADPLVAALQAPAKQLAPAASRLRPTLSEADRLLGRARPLLSALRPAATSLATASRTAQPVLDHLEPDLKAIDEKFLPDIARRSPESDHTTYEMIGPGLEALHVPFGPLDATGHYVRFLASGRGSVLDAAPCRTMLTDPSREELASCESLTAAISQVIGADPTKDAKP